MTISVESLNVTYGAVAAVKGVTIDVGQGALIGVVGPNGAGKTSLLKAIVGLAKPSGGHVFIEGVDRTGASPEKVAQHGVRLLPEGRRILASLTVYENLRLGASGRTDRRAIATDAEQMYGRFPLLGERRSVPAGLLSGGEQQMLAIARALMARPRILLLDEPTLGLAPAIVSQVFQTLSDLRADGLTLLLVEQNAHKTIALADYTYVMNGGRIVLEGDSDVLSGSRELVKSYLGAPV